MSGEHDDAADRTQAAARLACAAGRPRTIMAILEFSRRYAMAHRLLADPKSKCATPHGHNEIVTVRLAPLAQFRFGGANAEAPFEAVKGRWHRWIDASVDHALQLNGADPLIGFSATMSPIACRR